ncbi:MAG: hypothetical protein JW839_09345, partial [Candidatus Lokiarchaeota archaeon]|nr:hypothetical protein [Candidatus Lokiarchaeota archaeon]
MKRTSFPSMLVIILACVVFIGVIASTASNQEVMTQENRAIEASNMSVDWTALGPYNDPGTGVWCVDDYVFATRNIGVDEDFGIRKYWKNNGTFVTEYVYSSPDEDLVSDIWSDGTYLYTSGTRGTSMLVVKWSTTGSIFWERQFGSSVYNGKTIFGYGNAIYTCGFRQTTSNYADLSKLYASNGSVEWTQTIACGYEGVRDLWCNGSAVYLYTSSSPDNQLSRWETNGSLVWTRSHPAYSWDREDGIWSDGQYIYVTYEYSNDLRIRKYTSDGTLVWERVWDSGSYDFGASIWIDKKFVYVGGRTSPLSSGGDPTPVMVKYSTAGDFNSNYEVGQSWTPRPGGSLEETRGSRLAC